MKMVPLTIVVGQDGVYSFRIFGLAETALYSVSNTLCITISRHNDALPVKNSVVDSLYTSHFSPPMAPLSAEYTGSRSMRAGMIWLVFTGFPEPGAVMDRVLFDRVGVDRLTAGRLRAAGSMSGIVEAGSRSTSSTSRAARLQRATRRTGHELHQSNAEGYAIAAPESP